MFEFYPSSYLRVIIPERFSNIFVQKLQ